ncbi:MAG: hypothetical protein Q8M29_05135 [Bacteroidota bacterium]|nr:hypothetical protein [Bacteroidota bacterium]
MTEHYENIKNKTVCTECGGKEMGFAYLYEKSGTVKGHSKVLGMHAFTGKANMLMIVCNTCGFIAKSFAIAK